MLTVIPHLTQNTNNDCGLASVAMILSGIGRKTSLEELAVLCPLDSIWTIDLAYLLKRFGVEDFTMYTCHIGVNWTHNQNPFYKPTLQQDLKRIHQLFAKARDNQVRVVPQQLEIDDIRRFLLSNRYAILLLVNLQYLKCHLCKEKKRKEWYKSFFWFGSKDTISSTPMNIPPSPSSPITSVRRLSYGTFSASPTLSIASSIGTAVPKTKYSTPTPKMTPTRLPPLTQDPPKPIPTCSLFSCCTQPYTLLQEFIGHFIVLIGYDVENDMFFYRDPGTDSKLCAISGDELEKAYCQDTDYDCIVVRML